MYSYLGSKTGAALYACIASRSSDRRPASDSSHRRTGMCPLALSCIHSTIHVSYARTGAGGAAGQTLTQCLQQRKAAERCVQTVLPKSTRKADHTSCKSALNALHLVNKACSTSCGV